MIESAIDPALVADVARIGSETSSQKPSPSQEFGERHIGRIEHVIPV